MEDIFPQHSPRRRLSTRSCNISKTFFHKTAYLKLLDKRYSIPTAERKILNHGFTKENIHHVYMLPFRLMKETKLLMFQLKIIHGILPTHYSLFRPGLANHDKCPLCYLESQSLTHMLFTCCCKSMSFWNHFTRLWRIKFHQRLNLSASVISYGWHQDRNKYTSWHFGL